MGHRFCWPGGTLRVPAGPYFSTWLLLTKYNQSGTFCNNSTVQFLQDLPAAASYKIDDDGYLVFPNQKSGYCKFFNNRKL
jgi:hypothetical protein